MKKLSIMGAALLAISSMPAVAVETTGTTTGLLPGKVAVVNVQQILQQSPRVAELSKKLEAQFKERQQKIGDGQKTLQDQMDKLKKDSLSMTKKDRETTDKKLADQRSELMRQVVNYQQDLNKEQGKIMQGILSDLNKIVTVIAKKDGYPLVLEAGAVVYASEGNDITKKVADDFNSKK